MSQEQSKQSWRIDEGNGTALQILSVDDTFEWDICESPDDKFVLRFSGKCDDRFSMVKAIIYRDGKYELRAISFQSDGASSENVIFAGTCARKNKVW